MDLKDFVKETLVQISTGVQESIEEVRESGGFTNPAALGGTKGENKSHVGSMGEGQNVFWVDFDVAVTVDENSEVSGGGKLKVAGVFSVGGEAGSGTKSSSTNRVSFRIPLALPVDPISREEVNQRRAREQQKINEGLERLNRGLA
jgi:hypothetical protein